MHLQFEFTSQPPKEAPIQIHNPSQDTILNLHRIIGNQAVGRLYRAGTLQAKLKIGKLNDRYEQEAEQSLNLTLKKPNLQNEPLVSNTSFEPLKENSLTIRTAPNPSKKNPTKVGSLQQTQVATLSNWTVTLPRAVRNIRTKLKRGRYSKWAKPWTTEAKPTRLINRTKTTGGDKVIAAIIANRAKVKNRIGLAMLGPKFGQKRYSAYYYKKGIVYKGKTKATPKNMNRAQRIVWNEIKGEGGTSAV